MSSIFEIGIIGMGPAGIGMAMSLCGTSQIKNTVCFERGSYNTNTSCPFLTQNLCCGSETCSIISGIGGASTLSSGKISNFPAGSGLVDFFDSEQQLKEALNKIISVFASRIELKKIEIDAETQKNARLFYKQESIDYKYYDVYQFDGENYRNFIHRTVQELKEKGLQLFDNSEIIDISRDPQTSYFCIKAKMSNGEKLFFVRNLILATGALDIQGGLWKTILNSVTNCFEIGVRIEAPNYAFGNSLSTHGDLKLKFGSGRTYCVTAQGKIIAYQTSGVHFLEGCEETSAPTDYTNLAILIKYDDEKTIYNFIDQYRKIFKGIPIKQRFVDYAKGQISTGDVTTTLSSAICGDINRIFPDDINKSIKDFINDVLVRSMNIPEDAITLIAPELKILRNLQIAKNFELEHNLFVIGAATGNFRGILQSFCSGVRCGQLLARR